MSHLFDPSRSSSGSSIGSSIGSPIGYARGLAALVACLLVLGGCAQKSDSTPIANLSGSASSTAPADGSDSAKAVATQPNYSASIVVAGGCFWCIESDLEKLDGVGDVLSGYAGGDTPNPTYNNHSAHLEVVEAPYDPTIISYRELADYVLRHIDPLDAGGQFCDRGHSYTTAIFYRTDAEQTAAKASIAAAEKVLDGAIVTPVLALDKFWVAEDYHQNYYKVNPIRYKLYRNGCGRDDRVAEVWSGEH